MKKIILFISISVLGFISCKNVLDKVPLDIISDNTVWKNATLIDAYLTQAYAKTYILTAECGTSVNPIGGIGSYADNSELWTGWSWINGIGDESRMQWANSVASWKNGGILKYNDLNLLGWWDGAYEVIRMLNEFIQRVAASPMDGELKKLRIAEARFLRAYNYFGMVKRYGGVPLITVPQSINAPADSLYPKRDKEQKIYDFVISEMDEIAKDLPETNSTNDVGRPCKYAAMALESRAALYAGSIAEFGSVQLAGVLGIPANLASAYYQKAYDVSRVIITSGMYSLYNKNADKAMNFRQIFLDENNSEVIFVRPHTYSDGDAGGNGWSYDFFQCPAPQGWGGGNQDGPFLEMAEEFEHIDGTSGKLDRTAIQQGLWTMDQLWGNKDPRFFATIYTQNTPWKGVLLDWHNGIIKPDGTIQTDGSYNGVLAKGTQRTWDGTGFGVLKYLEESKNNFIQHSTSGTDWVVFRYGEILLNYAEAAFELGKTDDALNAINQVRSRAGIAALSTVDRDKIRHERKVELAFETHRYWDVRRWRIAVNVLSVSNSGLRYILDYSTGKFQLQVVNKIEGTPGPAFYPYNYYLPITLKRTGINPNLVENPGY